MTKYYTSTDDCDILFKTNTKDMSITKVSRESFYIDRVYFIDENGIFEYINRYKEKVSLNVRAGDIVIKVEPLRWITLEKDKEKDELEYPYKEFLVLRDPILKQNILSKRKLRKEIDEILKK